MILQGKALVMGDNVNTDVLHPSRFFSLDDQRVREGFLQASANREQGLGDLSGRIVLAGDNFGCGSSRETGARVFLLAGIRAVVARSMARIFSRNLRNLGLPALECPSLPKEIQDGAEIQIDLENWNLKIPALGDPLPLKSIDPYWKAVMAAGGLMPFLGFPEG
jgi:3-isopropylmalate/(R)-2-methylmalate dehydratase small subunit